MARGRSNTLRSAAVSVVLAVGMAACGATGARSTSSAKLRVAPPVRSTNGGHSEAQAASTPPSDPSTTVATPAAVTNLVDMLDEGPWEGECGAGCPYSVRSDPTGSYPVLGNQAILDDLYEAGTPQVQGASDVQSPVCVTTTGNVLAVEQSSPPNPQTVLLIQPKISSAVTNTSIPMVDHSNYSGDVEATLSTPPASPPFAPAVPVGNQSELGQFIHPGDYIVVSGIAYLIAADSAGKMISVIGAIFVNDTTYDNGIGLSARQAFTPVQGLDC